VRRSPWSWFPAPTPTPTRGAISSLPRRLRAGSRAERSLRGRGGPAGEPGAGLRPRRGLSERARARQAPPSDGARVLTRRRRRAVGSAAYPFTSNLKTSVGRFSRPLDPPPATSNDQALADGGAANPFRFTQGSWSGSSAIRLSPPQIRASGFPALGSSRRLPNAGQRDLARVSDSGRRKREAS
jgi:hypothetical protein